MPSTRVRLASLSTILLIVCMGSAGAEVNCNARLTGASGANCFRPAAEVWRQPERIAQLAEPSAERLPPPRLMKTGVLRSRKGSQPLAPLKLEAPHSADYLIKLVRAGDGSEEMLIYLRAGAVFETKVALGTYRIRGASGKNWYGEPHLFGKETRYFKLVSQQGSGEEFKFFRQGNQLMGRRIRLIQQVDGNLETPEIGAKEF